ncbi:hypothetical protein [Spongiactinospora sp. TRM90649]|uniref:hypothetical protein n=1 Tax=Spongiactinospora sp. TRM90649 TaxID=3031114 RepID=UPI0023F892D3|nr:hypothetical protein [Spongiactinospora sp. TRM90649]MDF5757364.1 hypothetical protein [Spongiactinospora sp. TRM90649]
MAEPPADDLDGDADVHEFGGVGVPQPVNVDLAPGGFAVALPAVVGGVVGQGPAGPADVLIVLTEVDVVEVRCAGFGGAGSAHVDRLE